MSPNKKQKTLLTCIRTELTNESIDAFIVGSGDAHQSEYVCEADMRLRFISSFCGSAGTALILQNEALLWTDGRYFLQAEKELPEGWTLMKCGQPGVLEMSDWILANMSRGQIVGVDASLISTAEAAKISATLMSAGISLKATTTNPVDTVWSSFGGDCPSAPKGKVIVHDIKLAGVTHKKKIEIVQECVRKASATAIAISMLDEVSRLCRQFCHFSWQHAFLMIFFNRVLLCSSKDICVTICQIISTVISVFHPPSPHRLHGSSTSAVLILLLILSH